ncbi:hypothetical protein LTR35_000284 [Friedmanniomyces endolithicus]|nr:hypothetical protein LTS00_011122 [Friedmanniomyces endolithicus]KAK0293678.1 hypothetical protein LTR35_000284 [Friedmanniomyces endolithicus]KAK0992984.1 hypothetical protein LTR54_011306 [Friedmanniomyces endolithicus]
MPPWVSRKRARSPSPEPTPPSKSARPAAKPAKPTLFDTVDAPAKRRKTVEETKKLLDELNEDDDSLSEADSEDFEDVPPAKRRKTVPATKYNDDGDSDDEMEWEDAIQNDSSAQPTQGPSTMLPELVIGDVSFSLKEDGGVADQGIHIPGLGKKGPSKREKFVRIQSHCLHVQSLMWHNTIRNSWLNDAEVQRTLVDGLAEGVKREVTRWKEAMGALSMEELVAKKKAAAMKGRGKRKSKGKGRDWHFDAEHAEQGVPNLSAGDPLLRLLKVLTAYWRKRFAITAPGLRKQGYMAIKRLRDEVKDWEKSMEDVDEHGERIESLAHFRKLAKTCEGSRDVGAQFFAALLRGLGLDTRMVASLQPVGFGFSKTEEAYARRPKKKAGTVEKAEVMSDSDVVEVKLKKGGSAKESKAKMKKKQQPARKPGRGKKDTPISLDDSESSLGSAVSDTGEAPLNDDEDDLSVIDITPSTPRRKPNKKYDRELAFPNYWVEVCSPATHKYIPVDPIVLSTIASNEDLLQTFEPRGKKAELAKQVMAYTIAFSTDGTAKDVTVRYLRKHQLPGKTKGMRMPAERVPIYNGKEEQTDLKPHEPEKQEKEVDKESLLWYKQSADFVLEQHLRREEALLPGSESVKSFTPAGKKGAKSTEIIPVYRREDVVACKTVESWHKEGRALREGQHPLKLVPMRAVTLIRKREMEDALRETGEKLKQGLYSREQTDWIIPPPIRDGVIPKNAFGNMDVYVPTMVPGGAVHVPLKGTAKLCRKLEIDYAEACTGFEFGKQRAVPVLTGVVVAEEHEILLRDAWREEQKEIKRKEDVKSTGVALQWWRKMVLGLRVLERMRVDYEGSGGGQDEVNPFVAKARREGRKVVDVSEQVEVGADEEGGGFFLPGHDEEEVPQHREKAVALEAGDDMEGGGGFLAESEEEDHHAGDGGFLVEEQPGEIEKRGPNSMAPLTPVSLQSLQKATGQANGKLNDVKKSNVSTTAHALPPLASRTLGHRAKPKGRANVKAIKESESSLSDIVDNSATSSDMSSDSDSDDTDTDDTDTDVKPALTSKNSKPTSPRVVLQPQTNARKPRAAKKSTPLKSQYFAASSAGESDDDEGQSTEAEVVLPRRTTARTARRGG